MDFQNYNDYMRSTMGFSGMNNPNMCMNMNCPSPYQNMVQPSDDDLERMYPDTYRIVHPMVVSACAMVNVSMPVTEDMVDRMTDDIYDRAVTDRRISVDINVGVESRENSSESSDDFRQMRPRRRNRFFRDFIRVLLLRELFRRRHQRFPFRSF